MPLFLRNRDEKEIVIKKELKMEICSHVCVEKSLYRVSSSKEVPRVVRICEECGMMWQLEEVYGRRRFPIPEWRACLVEQTRGCRIADLDKRSLRKWTLPDFVLKLSGEVEEVAAIKAEMDRLNALRE